MELRPGLILEDAVLADFASRHGIHRIAAFGSVLRDDFDDESDIDLLVEFAPGRVPGLLALAAMEIELGAHLAREVEIRTLADLSRHFRDDVRTAARQLYAAA